MVVPRLNTSATGGFLQPRPVLDPEDAALAAAIQYVIVGLTQLSGDLVREKWQLEMPQQPPANIDWCAYGIMLRERDDFPAIIHHGMRRFPGANGLGLDEQQRHETLTVLISFYGPNAESTAARMRDSIYLPQNLESPFWHGIKLLEADDVVKMAEQVNLRYINRADLKLKLRRIIIRDYPVLNFIGAKGELITDDGNPPTPWEVEVPEP